MAALLHGAAAAGQRLLLAAAGMAAAGAPAPAPLPLPVAQSAAPGPEVGATATPSNTSDSGYTVRAAEECPPVPVERHASSHGDSVVASPPLPPLAAINRCRLARRRART